MVNADGMITAEPQATQTTRPRLAERFPAKEPFARPTSVADTNKTSPIRHRIGLGSSSAHGRYANRSDHAAAESSRGWSRSSPRTTAGVWTYF